jgi:hypothetical protein
MERRAGINRPSAYKKRRRRRRRKIKTWRPRDFGRRGATI